MIDNEKLNKALEILKDDPSFANLNLEDVRKVLTRMSKPRKVEKFYKVDDFDAVVERMQEITNSPTVTDLQRLADINSATFTKARQAGHIPSYWLWNMLIIYSINPYYILFGGENKKFLAVSDNPGIDRV